MEMINHILISLGTMVVVFVMGIIWYIANSAFRLKEPDLKKLWKPTMLVAFFFAVFVFIYLRLFYS